MLPRAHTVQSSTSPPAQPVLLPAPILPPGSNATAHGSQQPYTGYYVPIPRFQGYVSLESVTQQVESASRQISALSSSIEEFYKTFQAFTGTYNSYVSNAEKQASVTASWFKKYAEIQVKSSNAVESRVKEMETVLHSLVGDREQQAKQIQDTHFATHEILEMLKDNEAGSSNLPHAMPTAKRNTPFHSTTSPIIPISVPPGSPAQAPEASSNPARLGNIPEPKADVILKTSAPSSSAEGKIEGVQEPTNNAKEIPLAQASKYASQPIASSSSAAATGRLTRSQSNKSLTLSRASSYTASSSAPQGSFNFHRKDSTSSKRKSDAGTEIDSSPLKRTKRSISPRKKGKGKPTRVQLSDDGKWPEAVNGSDWIQCDDCNAWYHHGCVGIPRNDFVLHDESTKYTCPECVADPDVIVRHEDVKVGTQRCHRGEECANEDPEGEERYTIARLLGKRPGWWLIEWSGYDFDNATWEPESNLSDPQKLISKFQSSVRVKVKASNGRTIEVLKEIKDAIPKTLLG